MKSLSKTICHLTYNLRYFVSMLLFTTCSLSFIAFGADGDTSTSKSTSTTNTPTLIKLKRQEPKTNKPNQPTNSTLSTVSTTPLVRNNPCNLIKIKDSATDKEKDAAKSSCNNFFNDQKAAGNQSSFAKAVAVNTAKELLNAVNNAHDNGTIIILSFGEYLLTEQLSITKRVALVGMKQNDALPTIRMTSALLETAPEEHTLVYLYRQTNAASKGFYSAFIKWETNIDKVDYEGSVKTIVGSSYPGEIRLYGNTFIHSDENVDLDEFVSLSNPGGMVYIDSNQFNTSNLYYSAVYSTCTGCTEFEPEVIITNNTLTSSDNANNDSDYAFHLFNHTKFTIENNTSLNSTANASINIYLTSGAKLQSSIKNNIAHAGASIEHRMIEVEQKGCKITGSLTISGNDYFDVDHEDDLGGYIALAEGKKVPAFSSSAAISLSPTPTSTSTSVLIDPSVTTTPAPAKNPCEAISHDSLAYKTCNDFLANSQATGGDNDFSHAFVVHNAHELLKAVEKDHLDGNPFSGSIIILKAGSFTLHRQLRINHRVAFVGEQSGSVLPRIQAGKDIPKQSYEFNSLVYLKKDLSQPTSGFFSSKIIWDTSLDTETKGIVCEAAIGSSNYSGKIRIFQNQFKHQQNKTDVNDFIKLKNSYGDTYIGHNTFDTTYLKYATVDARCVNCINFDPNLEIVSNSFTSKEDSKRKTVATALEIKGYKRFRIERNEQKNTKAAAYINVQLKNDTAGLNGLIRYNVALQGAPADQKEIKLHSFKKHGLPLSISGSLTTTPNTHYSIDDTEGLVAHIGSTIEESSVAYQSTQTTPVATATLITPTPSHNVPSSTQSVKSISTPSAPGKPSVRTKTPPLPSSQPWLKSTAHKKTPPPLNSLCDRLSSIHEIQHCHSFQDKLKKMELDITFSEVVAVKSSKELISEAAGASESGKVILLHTGSYLLDQPLHMRNKIALVGVGNPVIKSAHTVYSTESRALILLNDEATSHGFYSKGITWDITAPGNSESQPYSSAIKAMNYQGDVVILDDDFQYQSTQEGEEAPAHYIDIQKSTGNVHIADNTFFTGGLKEATIYANCKECLKDNQYIDIVGNRFTDTEDEKSTLIAIDVRHYKALNIHRNVQETKSATAKINIVLPNYKDDINALIEGNIALASAATEKRTIFLAVDRPAKVPVSISGSVRVFNNRCYTVRDNGIPSHILDTIRGGCSATASSQAQSETQASRGLNSAKWAGTSVGVGLTLLYIWTGIHGSTKLPGHATAHAIFIFPKTVALLITSQIAEQFHKIRGHHQQDDRSNINFNTLKNTDAIDSGDSNEPAYPLVETGRNSN